jgi:hypothetical protein
LEVTSVWLWGFLSCDKCSPDKIILDLHHFRGFGHCTQNPPANYDKEIARARSLQLDSIDVQRGCFPSVPGIMTRAMPRAPGPFLRDRTRIGAADPPHGARLEKLAMRAADRRASELPRVSVDPRVLSITKADIGRRHDATDPTDKSHGSRRGDDLGNGGTREIELRQAIGVANCERWHEICVLERLQQPRPSNAAFDLTPTRD